MNFNYTRNKKILKAKRSSFTSLTLKVTTDSCDDCFVSGNSWFPIKPFSQSGGLGSDQKQILSAILLDIFFKRIRGCKVFRAILFSVRNTAYFSNYKFEKLCLRRTASLGQSVFKLCSINTSLRALCAL